MFKAVRIPNLNKRPLRGSKSTAFKAFSILLLASASVAQASTPELCQAIFDTQIKPAHVRTYEASQTTSQFIRDNAPDYWRWSKLNSHLYFNQFLKYQGLVIGDAHPGNFIYSPLGGKMRFFIMDIKDAGHGPFIVDIAHQIMATNSIFKRGEEKLDRSTERQFEAYMTGLRGEDFQAQSQIGWIFETNLQEFHQSVTDYVERQTRINKFKLKSNKLESIDSRMSVQIKEQIQNEMTTAIRQHFSGAKVLDFAFRPRERGGSKNLIRYWALLEYRGKKQIIEFKEIESPAVEQYGPQLPHIERFNLVMSTFWGVNDHFYQAVEIGGKAYWMRPKKVDVFSVPYKQRDTTERKFLRHLAAYEAYLMGQYHGSQMKQKTFVKELERQKEEIIRKINQMSNDYLSRLESTVERLQETKGYD